jgi:cytochrome P450
MVNEPKIKWNPYSKGYFSDPYPHLKLCRDENPIQEGLGDSIFLFKYDDIHEIIRSKDFIVSDLSAFFEEREDYIFKNTTACPFLSKGTKKWPMYLNGEEHKKIKIAITKAFNSLPINEILEKAIQETNLEFQDKSEIDLVDYCSNYIFKVTDKIFNFENFDSEFKIKEFSNLLAKSQDLYVPKQVYNKINDAFLWGKDIFPFSAFKDVIIKETKDLSLTEEEIYSIMTVSFMASYETSKDSLIISLLEIIKNKELIETIHKSKTKELNSIIEEIFRFATPLQYTIRINTKPYIINNQLIEENTKFFLCLASANRDETIFPDSEKLIPNREYLSHLAFGGGEHFCLGSNIARQELRIALKPMVSFLENYSLKSEEEVKWGKQIFMRTALKVPLVINK